MLIFRIKVRTGKTGGVNCAGGGCHGYKLGSCLAEWGRGLQRGRGRRIETRVGGVFSEGESERKRSLHEFPDRWAAKLLRHNRVTEWAEIIRLFLIMTENRMSI